MGNFVNIWAYGHGPCHQCVDCGIVVYGLDGIQNHNCRENNVAIEDPKYNYLNNLMDHFQFEYNPLHPNAQKPRRATRKSIGYDIFSPTYFQLFPNECKTIGLGFSAKFTEGYACLLWDKSGLAAKKKITVLAGLIDPDYPDEWGVVLWNTSQNTYEFKIGDKITQCFFFKAEFPIGLPCSEDERIGGFGSTGT